jgi:xanthosine phosphorylase
MNANYDPKILAKSIHQHAPDFTPQLALILGSGLSNVAQAIDSIATIPYADLPGIYQSQVSGHSGQLILGHLNHLPVVCLQGRAHLYEGIPRDMIKCSIRALKLLGCQQLFLTNAAGSLNPAIPQGSLMLIKDHLNFMFDNPLVGANDETYGERFVSLENAYSPQLREIAQQVAQANQITLHEGVYLGVIGPSFETPAEIRAFQMLGADAVGMSTVPEAIVARHCGLEVIAMSAITNMAVGLSDTTITHDVTLQYGKITATTMQQLILAFARKLADEH